MTSTDLIDHYKLEAHFHSDHVQHVENTSDRARGKRKVTLVKKWYRVKELGRGGFGTVWLEVERQQPAAAERAVKELSKKYTAASGIDYRKEMLAMAKLSKFEEVFVQFYGWYENDEHVFLALEYFNHGDLQQYIAGGIPESEVRTIVTQLLEGLVIMHDNNFTHRDLKPQNIFVAEQSPNWWVKIGDFGITKRIESDHTVLQTVVGTRHFQAPEILGLTEESRENPEYSNAVDIWALGCVAYEILTQNVPFPKLKDLVAFTQGRTSFPAEPLCDRQASEECVSFVRASVTTQPKDRLTARTALKVSWLRGQTEDSSIDLHNVITNSRQLIQPKNGSPNVNQKPGNSQIDYASMNQNISNVSAAHKSVPCPPTGLVNDASRSAKLIVPRNCPPNSASPAINKMFQETANMIEGITGARQLKMERNDKLSKLWNTKVLCPINKRLLQSAALGHTGRIKEALHLGASLKVRNRRGWTPLHLATLSVSPSAVQLLLKRGDGLLEAKTVDGLTPVNLASAYADSATSKLVENWPKRRLPFVHKELVSAIQRRWFRDAVINGDLKEVEKCLQKKVELECMVGGELSVLHLAAINGHERIVQLLLEAGARVQAVARSGWTPLHCASQHGHLPIVKLLLEKGADVSSPLKDGGTCASLASGKGHDAVATVLLSWPNALREAAGTGDQARVRKFIELAFDLNAKDQDGQTALHLATRGNHKTIIHQLLEMGANVDEEDKLQQTALIIACDKGYVIAARILLEYRADVNLSKRFFGLPLARIDQAGHGGQRVLVQLLLERGAKHVLNSYAPGVQICFKGEYY